MNVNAARLTCDSRVTVNNNLAWTVRAELPAERYRAASAVVDGKLWLMGGWTGHEAATSVLLYDADHDSWTAGPPLPRGVGECHAAVLSGEIHLVFEERSLVRRGGAWEELPGADCEHTGACTVSSILLG